jgi:hypothetical protein
MTVRLMLALLLRGARGHPRRLGGVLVGGLVAARVRRPAHPQHDRKERTMKVRLVLAAASLTALALLAAGSAGAGAYRVTGTASVDLWSGTLYSTSPVVTTIESGRFNEASGVFHVSGTELFTGCLAVEGPDPCGTLTFSFQAWGNFDPAGNFVRGGCQHWIVDSGGGLAGATGFITMHDRPATTYRGHITL